MKTWASSTASLSGPDVRGPVVVVGLFCAGVCRSGFRLESGRILHADDFGWFKPNQPGSLRSGENRGRKRLAAFLEDYVAYAEADDSAGGYPGNGTRYAGF